jgi:hypothetical protein
MSYSKNSLFFILILIAGATIVILLTWRNATWPASYADVTTVLTTTTATLGTLLGIITAGLMFTHGKFSELESELIEKSPDYLIKTLSLEKVQDLGTHLISLRKAFSQLEAETVVPKEKSLYRRIVDKATTTFLDLAVLLNLKLQQQGLPETGFLISEMDSQLYARYQKKRRDIKKDWQILATIKQMVDVWEGSVGSVVERSERRTSLQSDLKSSISILDLKERLDKSSKNIHIEIEKAVGDLSKEIGKIERQLHEDRIPQLLSQMEDASALRGKYFYLALVFIAAPLFISLIVLPQLSESTVPLFRQVIMATSLLSIMGVAFLLLYIHKILSV